MVRKMRRNCLALLLMFSLVLPLAACGKKEADTTEIIKEQDFIGTTSENTIRLSQNGAVTEIAVEDYADVEYKLPDLEKYIRDQVAAFNREKGVDKVAFLQIREEGTVIKTAISFSDIETYNAFNHMNVQLSVYNASTADQIAAEEAKKHAVEEEKRELSEAELAEAGYDASSMEQEEIDTMVEEKAVTASFRDPSGNTVNSEAIDANENLMIITDEKLAVEVPDGALRYANSHAAFEGNAAHTDGKGTAIVVVFLGI